MRQPPLQRQSCMHKKGTMIVSNDDANANAHPRTKHRQTSKLIGNALNQGLRHVFRRLHTEPISQQQNRNTQREDEAEKRGTSSLSFSQRSRLQKYGGTRKDDSDTTSPSMSSKITGEVGLMPAIFNWPQVPEMTSSSSESVQLAHSLAHCRR